MLTFERVGGDGLSIVQRPGKANSNTNLPLPYLRAGSWELGAISAAFRIPLSSRVRGSAPPLLSFLL
jgi:hypothetical protein